jgi:hypothetical protein
MDAAILSSKGNPMPDRFVETHIQQLPLFARLPPDQLRWATDAFRVMRFEPGEMIFAQGEPTQGLHMFITGRGVLARAEPTGRQRQIGAVGPNQYLNEGALFKPGIETASLQVTERATVLFVERKRLMTVIAHHPELRQYIPIPAVARQTQEMEMAFKGQRPNETVLLETRQHWFAFIRKAWLPGVALGAMLMLAGLTDTAFMQLCIGVLAIIVPGLIMFYFYLEWQNDHIIVTSHRLVHIQRTIHTLETRINEVTLVSIHEVNVHIARPAPLSQLMGYGTLEVKTAGDAGNIILTLMPDPTSVQKMILKNRVQQQDGVEIEHRNVIRAEVDKVLGRNGEAPPAPVEHPAEEDRMYRKHFTLWLKAVILPGMLVFSSFILFFLTFTINLGALGPLFAFLMFMIGAIGFYWAHWDWRNDQYIIGNEVIRMIHRRPLFLQNENDQFLLESVDNVVSERKGLLPSLLDYGDVRIALLGGDVEDTKVFRSVSHPQAVQAEITRRQALLRNREKDDAERQRREEIGEYLTAYHEMTGDDPNQMQSAPPQQPATRPAPRPQQPRQQRPPRIPRPKNDG